MTLRGSPLNNRMHQRQDDTIVASPPPQENRDETPENIQNVENINTEEPTHVQNEQPEPEQNQLNRPKRTRRAPERLNLMVKHQDDEVDLDDDEPKTYSEAVLGTDSEMWLGALKSEMDSMYYNSVWELVDLPLGARPIGCKWIFKKKRDADGKVQTYKARLVAKGFSQREGIDYDETFSPVAKIKSIRILLAVAAHFDFDIWQMDVKTAFLNGELEGNVFMAQPEGFVSKELPNAVCKLKKSIYGLKQASRSWNICFDKAVKLFDFVRSKEDPCVYSKRENGNVVYLIIYVDDILIMGSNRSMMQSVKDWLSKSFMMKDLGDASYILGIKIYRDRPNRLLGLSQSTYIDKLLRRFSMENSKKGFLPMGHGIVLSKKGCPSNDKDIEYMKGIPYASAIGSIMYAMICTRPDVAYALSMTGRFQQNPGEEHWRTVKTILKYLRRTKDYFLVYGGQPELSVTGYTDASFQTDHDDYKSQSGYVFLLNGGAVSWNSSKQSTTADSTTEAEYIAASEAAKEAVALLEFMRELDIAPSASNPIPLYCDNTGAVAQAKEPRATNRNKHVPRRYHLIREIIEMGNVKLERVPTDDNLADPFTKPLCIEKHNKHFESLGVRQVGSWL